MVKSWFSTERTYILSVLVVVSFSICLLPKTAFTAEKYSPWAGEFLRMGVGAKAMGMGNAYSAIEGDIFSSYYNPAGLAVMDGRQLAVSQRYMSMDRYMTHLAFGSRIGPDADFAFSWIGAGTDDVQGRDLNGNKTGIIKDSRNSFAISFAKSMGGKISVGLNTKISLWKLAGEDAKAIGFDGGIIFRPVKNITASFVVRDINSRFTWKSERWSETISGADGQPMEKEDKLPLYYTVGMAYRSFDDKLIISAMTESVQDNPTGFDFGAAYKVMKAFTLRGGIYNYTPSGGLDAGSLTVGFSLQVTGTIALDYAYTNDTIANDKINLISLDLSYGE
ncbi:MAG: PorV/PorQ family protein [Candidatus Latescibacterota bacterium]